MIELGTTSRGNKIRINKLVTENDKLLVISSVEPHYFAGYTGGRKSILPGIAAYETIEKNHSFVLLPGAEILRLTGNPVHEDMQEAAAMLPIESRACLLVLDRNQRVFSAEFDTLENALLQAIPTTDQVYSVNIKKRADIVVGIMAPPLDSDLYQAHKGIENARNAIAEDGIFILVSACSQGIGNDNFYKLLSACTSPEEVFDKIKEQYRLGYHKAGKLADFMRKHQLWIVSEMKDEIPEKIFIKPFADLQTALDAALQLKGKQAEIFFINDAGIVVPKVG